MKSILRALALTGIVGFVAAAGAQAQTRVYVGFGSPVAAVVPPCPGDGYAWTAGYYEGGVWVPGRWIYRGYDRDDYFRARVDVGRRYYDYDRDRRYDQDRDRYRDDRYRDHDHR
jgi:hypothetical protein